MFIKIADKNELLASILQISLFIYLFFLLFPHTNTIKEIAFWILFVIWLIIRFKNKATLLPLNQINISLSIFVFIALIATIVSKEVTENLIRFKGDVFIPFIVFLVVATEIKNVKQIKKLLFVLIISLAVYMLFALMESVDYVTYYFGGEVEGMQYPWKIEISLFFPVTLGMLLLIKDKLQRFFLSIFALMEFAFIMANRSVSVTIGTILALLLWMVFVKPKKLKIWILIFIFIMSSVFSGIVYFHKDNLIITEYIGKFAKIRNISQEFKHDSGLTNRIALWKAGSDIIKERPIIGYGWGVKKFKKLVQREDFNNQWKTRRPYVYALVNNELLLPHNIFIDIAIQSGLLGVVSFLFFFITYICNIVKYWMQNNSDTSQNFLLITIGGVISIFMITNLLNSEFGYTSGKIFFAVLGVGAAWIKSKC